MPLVIAAFLVGRAAHAQTGRITGQVTDTAGGRPIAGVEITVAGEGNRAQVGARTDAAGKYTLGAVAAGTVQLRVRMLGYAPKDRQVTVVAGQTLTADFLLSQRSIQLDQVVVTGTGGAVERRAVGNVIESINANEVLKAAAPRSVEQLIGARTPGVVVLPATGQVGTGAQIRIRSVGSLSLATDPIVYIDGVRMDANTAQGPTQRGGAGASRLNDINPEDIESIEIIKGPAAATLYGTEASNGVVQIITKRGSNSTPHWDFATRQGQNWLANPEGRAGLLWSKNATTGALESFNLYRYAIDHGTGAIFSHGDNQGYSLNLHGGNDITRYYLSSSFDDDNGVVSWNWDKKFAGRANVDIEANKKLRIEGSLGYIRDRIRLAQNGSINPDPFSNLVWGRASLIPTTGGFGFAPASLWDDVEDHADVDRMTTSVTARYEPFPWFTHRLALGLDVNAENNWTLYPRETADNAGFYGSNGLGAKTVERASRNFLTLDYSGNLKYSLRSYDFTTSMGLQAYRSELSNITASGTTFPASPITTVSGTTTRNATEGYSANATVGLFVQQALAWNNRLFLTAALRGDDNSAFGKDYSAAYYPKVSASWVLSEEPFWKEKVGRRRTHARRPAVARRIRRGRNAARHVRRGASLHVEHRLSERRRPGAVVVRKSATQAGAKHGARARLRDVAPRSAYGLLLHALRPQRDRRDRERPVAAVRRLPGESGRQHRSHADVGQRARRELPHSAGPSSCMGSRHAARQQRQSHRRPRRWSDIPDGRRWRPGAEPRRLRRRRLLPL